MIQLRYTLKSKEAVPKGNFVHSRTHNKKIQYNLNQSIERTYILYSLIVSITF